MADEKAAPAEKKAWPGADCTVCGQPKGVHSAEPPHVANGCPGYDTRTEKERAADAEAAAEKAEG